MNVPEILDLKLSSKQIFERNIPSGAPVNSMCGKIFSREAEDLLESMALRLISGIINCR